MLMAPPLAVVPATARVVGAAALLVVAVVGLWQRARLPPVARALLVALVTAGVGLLLAGWLAPMPDPARRTLAVAVLMASWWISVAIPIPATSLVPLVLFPALGVMPTGEVAQSYANSTIFLFLGGFVLALGIQRWGLHRRIALHIVRLVGTNPARMVLGFMLACATLSMWISNTATALMMLPIAMAVITSVGEVSAQAGAASGEGGPDLSRFGPALLLGVAYAASIGGLATPIGTPPNISFLRIVEILYPQAPPISFGAWLVAFLPLVALFVPLAWLVLTRVTHPVARTPLPIGGEVIRAALAKLGPMRAGERRMLIIFVTTALAWITRGDLNLGSVRVPGWAGALEAAIGAPFQASYLHDATVAMAMALLCFVIPGGGRPDPLDEHASADASARGADGDSSAALMDWPTARTLPWGILLLFGGGFALASAFASSGLSEHLGRGFADLVGETSPLVLVIAVCLLLTYLTEVTSNTATTEVMLPVLAGAAGAMAVNPLLLMLPATLSASCAFMLPIATPPNAIVFGSGQVDMRDMVRAGLVLNLVGVALVSAVVYLFASWSLGVDLSAVPPWAAAGVEP
ncbi:MAG: DASS family sodium-coupled anion symporter [Haliangiales bacterium]